MRTQRSNRADGIQLEDIFGPAPEGDSGGLNRVLAVLAQVSLAVLILFIMIAILFSSASQKKAEHYQKRWETLQDSSHAKALIEIQRQKLLLAIEQTNQFYRVRLGHHTFYRSDTAGRRRINTENIITGRRIRTDFVDACAFANRALGDVETFRKAFRRAVLSRADLAEQGADADQMTLYATNRGWLNDQVNRSTTALYKDTLRLQEDAREGLARYYQENLSEIEALQALAVQWADDPTADTIRRLIGEVERFVDHELERQQVKRLPSTAGSGE